MQSAIRCILIGLSITHTHTHTPFPSPLPNQKPTLLSLLSQEARKKSHPWRHFASKVVALASLAGERAGARQRECRVEP